MLGHFNAAQSGFRAWEFHRPFFALDPVIQTAFELTVLGQSGHESRNLEVAPVNREQIFSFSIVPTVLGILPIHSESTYVNKVIRGQVDLACEVTTSEIVDAVSFPVWGVEKCISFLYLSVISVEDDCAIITTSTIMAVK